MSELKYKEGTMYLGEKVDIDGNVIKTVDNPEFMEVTTDPEGKIINAITKEGEGIVGGVNVNQLMRKVASINLGELKEELDKEVARVKDELGILPDYYHTDNYIENRVEKINTLWMNGGEYADLFMFFTDAHYVEHSKKTGIIAKYLYYNTHLRKVFYGGDTNSVNTGKDVLYYEVDWNNRMAAQISSVCKYFPMKGNHDNYNRTRPSAGGITKSYPMSATINSILNQCNVDSIVLNENDIAPYYYYDERFSKIRYIVIDTFYKAAWNVLSDEQVKFIAQALLDTPAGYDNILLSHINVENSTIHDADEYRREDTLRQLIKAVQDNGVFEYDGQVFDYANNSNKIVMYISGHSHEDQQNYVNGTLYVVVPNSANYGGAELSPMYTYHHYTAMAKDTVTEDCFDVVMVDRANSVVNMVRIGCGFDRKFNLNKNEMLVDGTLQLASSFNNVSYWLIHDSQGAEFNSSAEAGTERWTFTNNVATIDNNGIVTALSSGECYAIAIAENGDKEFFYISVN